MKYTLVKTGPVVYIVMCLLYALRLDILFYNKLPLLFNMAAFAIAITAFMVFTPRINTMGKQAVLAWVIAFSFIIAYTFNGAMFGEMDRIMADAPARDRIYRAFCTAFLIPMGLLLPMICGNFYERIWEKKTRKQKAKKKLTRNK